MSTVKSVTIVCPECGEGNRTTARFCTACAARLGAEPSVSAGSRPGPRASAPAPLLRDSRHDAPRTVLSSPMPFGAPPSDSATFLVKFCIAGLIVMIGFIGWALYMLTGSKAVPVLPVSQGSASTSASVASSPALPVSPALPPPPPVPIQPVRARDAAEAPAAMAATPRAAEWPASEGRRAVAARRQAARERAQPPVSIESAGEATMTGNWVAPTRPPASTSSPLYQDPGPPVVQGPGPREWALPAAPYLPPRAGGTGGMQGADPGPPIAEGPGPRYDYSTPGAVGR